MILLKRLLMIPHHLCPMTGKLALIFLFLVALDLGLVLEAPTPKNLPSPRKSQNKIAILSFAILSSVTSTGEYLNRINSIPKNYK